MIDHHLSTRQHCPGCEADAGSVLYQAPYDAPPISTYLEDFYNPQGKVEPEHVKGGLFQLTECGTCGLVYQTHIPDDLLMERVYEHWIDPDQAFEYDSGHHADYYAHFATQLGHVLRHLGGPTKNVRALDFGMGWGNWCRLALAFGCLVDGIELSERRIEHGRSLGIHVIGSVDERDADYHFINTEQVFEHIPEPLGTLRAITSALRPDGLIKISVPNGWNVKTLLDRADWTAPKFSEWSLNCVAPLEHINCFKQQSVEHMAAHCGLVPVHPFPPTPIKGLLDRSPRDLLRPSYRFLMRRLRQPHPGSTCLFFKRGQ